MALLAPVTLAGQEIPPLLPDRATPPRQKPGPIPSDSREGAPVPEPRQRPTILRHYDPDLSIRAFMACDLDRDDRITYREAFQTLDVKTPTAFRAWDRLNHGWIHFPEFDRVFRQRIRDGQGLTLHGPAAARIGRPEPVPSRSLSALFHLLDLDQDGSISAREWQAAPGELASLLERIPQGFFGLDLDRDGRISRPEFGLLEQFLADRFPVVESPSLPRTILPPELQRADRNRDQFIQREELESFLASLDPSLALWIDPIFRNLDRNADGRISPREARALIDASEDRSDPARK